MPSHSPGEMMPSIFGAAAVAWTASDGVTSAARAREGMKTRLRRRAGTGRKRSMLLGELLRAYHPPQTAQGSKGYRTGGNNFATDGSTRAIAGVGREPALRGPHGCEPSHLALVRDRPDVPPVAGLRHLDDLDEHDGGEKPEHVAQAALE